MEALSVYARISPLQLRRYLTAALEEDIRSGDLTSEILVPSNLQVDAYLLIKGEGVLAGVEVFREVFLLLDPTVEVRTLMGDGSQVKHGDVPVRLKGRARALLAAERTALNIMQKMSGVATATAQLVALAAPHGVRVNHIRKTTPLMRALEVYSVRVGGGTYNRVGLDDGVLIKDNHLVVARRMGLSLAEVVARCREQAPLTVKVGLEIADLAELAEAIQASPDYLVLDNMHPEDIRQAVAQVAGRIPIDVTGGVNAANLEAIASTGIQMVGVGSITHSAPSLDMSLEIELEA
jgi:nicotinate-nucleotide pyrophosphorylase (carboxylating)